MKILFIIFPFLCLACSFHSGRNINIAKTDFASDSIMGTFRLICNEPAIENLILSSDTSYDYPDYTGHTITYFDKNNKPIKVFESNLFESNINRIVSATTIYDSVGRIIYEDRKQGFFRWHCYCYSFNKKGHLIFKEGYSSGEIGVKVSYYYQKGKLVKEVSEREGQKTEIKYYQ